MTTALEKLLAENTWQDIKDAPERNTDFMLKLEGYVTVGNTPDGEVWWDALDHNAEFEPDSFRPLPDHRLAEVCKVLLDELCEIREIWAGAECGEPIYAQEAYAIHLCSQMYKSAVEALAKAEEIAAGESR